MDFLFQKLFSRHLPCTTPENGRAGFDLFEDGEHILGGLYVVINVVVWWISLIVLC